MAIPFQVGDALLWDVFDVPPNASAIALTRGAERLERVIEITIRAHPQNTGVIYLGDRRRQDFPLAANETATFLVSRLGGTYFRGANVTDRLLVVYSMATEPIPHTDERQAGPNAMGIPMIGVVTTGAFLPDPYVRAEAGAQEVGQGWDDKRAIPWRDDRSSPMR